MSPEEYIARMEMKKNAPQEESIVNIASPEAVTKESFMASAPDYTTSFMQQPKKEPGALEQVSSYIADSALNKSLDKGMDKGTQMFTDKVVNPMKTWWGTLANPSAAAGAGQSLTSGAGAAAAGNMAGATGAAAPGVMAKLGAAASGAGSGMMAGLGALGPIGLGLGGIMLAKRFGLFNQGGAVGPLSPQYHADGDEVEDPMARPRYLMYPYQSNIETPMARPRPMTYGEAYDQAYGKYGFDHMEPESAWGKSLYHGFNKALSPSIALDAKIMQWQHNKEMRDAGVPGFNQGGSIGPLGAQYKEGGGEAEDPWGITRRPVQTSSTITPTYYSGRRPPWAPRGVLSQGASKHGPLRSGYSSRLGDFYNNMKPNTDQPQSTKIEKKETIEYKN